MPERRRSRGRGDPSRLSGSRWGWCGFLAADADRLGDDALAGEGGGNKDAVLGRDVIMPVLSLADAVAAPADMADFKFYRRCVAWQPHGAVLLAL